jgi:hypothetical protein
VLAPEMVEAGLPVVFADGLALDVFQGRRVQLLTDLDPLRLAPVATINRDRSAVVGSPDDIEQK